MFLLYSYFLIFNFLAVHLLIEEISFTSDEVTDVDVVVNDYNLSKLPILCFVETLLI